MTSPNLPAIIPWQQCLCLECGSKWVRTYPDSTYELHDPDCKHSGWATDEPPEGEPTILDAETENR